MPEQSAGDEYMKSSNELVRWLKMLALPGWAKAALATVMLLVLFSAIGLLIWAVYFGKIEVIASAVSILTIGLPIGLIVVALVFGDGGATKLRKLTELVLTHEIPDAIRLNLDSGSDSTHHKNVELAVQFNGCIAEYALSVDFDRLVDGCKGAKLKLDFKLEVNVKKINFVVWLPCSELESQPFIDQLQDRYKSCFFGAGKEGYVQNTTPIARDKAGFIGFVFIKNLGGDFLLNVSERLYFSQDLAFFVRGLLSVEHSNV
jgi:hypothetical protein